MSPSPARVGLSLSGGGYRAAAFHLGTLRKLHQLAVLSRVDIISTISGGSITGACYCRRIARGGDFKSFSDEMYESLNKKNVIRRVLLSWLGLRMLLIALLLLGAGWFLFTPNGWIFLLIWILLFTVLLKWQFVLLPISKRIEEIYDQFFYHKDTLASLPDHPVLVIGATNLQTARPFVFTRKTMQDSSYEFLDDPVRFRSANFPLARAVMASSCVPFAFTPVAIAPVFFENPEQATRFHPVLVDGGVYDNQGIHKVMQTGRYECDIVITSDAGVGSTGELRFRNTLALLVETVNVFMSRIKKAQMKRSVYDNAANGNKQIAYFSLGWDPENCIDGFIRNMAKKQVPASVIAAHAFHSDWINDPLAHEEAISMHLKARIQYDQIPKPDVRERELARKVGTNLTALRPAKLNALIAMAETLTEIQVKLYCPLLFTSKS